MSIQDRLSEFKILCEEGFSTKEILNKMNITRRTLNNYENKLGIKCKKDYRKANLNENFFDNIDNEFKAYILGFIYADGYIESNERTLTFNINLKDIDVLEKIRKCINSNGNYAKSSTPNCVRLHLSSVKIVKSLKEIGVTRNKTKTIKFPKIKEELYRHFLRGYFDGDGHIGKRQCALVIGSETMFNDFYNFIYEKFGIKLYYQKNNNYYRVQFNRKDKDIIDWLYSDSQIYLDRKYTAYIENWKYYNRKDKK